jgi:hypothetical protein
MKQVRVFLTSTEVLTYGADCARAAPDGYGGNSSFTEISSTTETVTPEYTWTGRFKRDWHSWNYEQVALIKTDLIDRIEIVEVVDG